MYIHQHFNTMYYSSTELDMKMLKKKGKKKGKILGMIKCLLGTPQPSLNYCTKSRTPPSRPWEKR